MTTHPHLEGLIRNAIQIATDYRDGIIGHHEMMANMAALAALPGGGVDVTQQLDRLESCAKEVGWHNAMKARNSGPMSEQDFRAYDGAHRGIAGARRSLTAALTPTPSPHEADRNG